VDSAAVSKRMPNRLQTRACHGVREPSRLTERDGGEAEGVVYEDRLTGLQGTILHSTQSQDGVEQHKKDCNCGQRIETPLDVQLFPPLPSLLHLERHAVVDLHCRKL
jgi:hypothetical protein